jgi:hypothetical protein
VLVGWAQKPRPSKKQKAMEEKPRRVTVSPVKEEIVIAFDSDAEAEVGAAGARISDVGEIPMMIVSG